MTPDPCNIGVNAKLKTRQKRFDREFDDLDFEITHIESQLDEIQINRVAIKDSISSKFIIYNVKYQTTSGYNLYVTIYRKRGANLEHR